MLSIEHPNSIAICAFVSHTVSPSIRTSNRMLLSGLVEDDFRQGVGRGLPGGSQVLGKYMASRSKHFDLPYTCEPLAIYLRTPCHPLAIYLRILFFCGRCRGSYFLRQECRGSYDATNY